MYVFVLSLSPLPHPSSSPSLFFRLFIHARHVYATASMAYDSMFGSGKDQVCVISGESGAGKTEVRTKLKFNQEAEECFKPLPCIGFPALLSLRTFH